MSAAVAGLAGFSGFSGSAGDGPVVDVRDLVVKVRRGSRMLTLVDGVSYSVGASESLAIVGESGAGKSIGVRAVLGLLDPDRFEVTGTVALGGVVVGELPRARRLPHVTSVAALMFQDPGRSLNPTMRVGAQIAEAMLNGSGRSEGLSRAQARERGIALMRDVGIGAPTERYHAYPHELSGGMKQRIVIAIALACRPRVLFCDEPTSALDVTTQAAIMDLLDGLRAEHGIATVTITHDLALAASRAERVLVMYGGQVVESLPARGIARHARMPYTRALIAAAPDVGVVGRPPQPIEGAPPDPRDPPPGCAFEPRCTLAHDRCRTARPILLPLTTSAAVGVGAGGSVGHEVRCWVAAPPADRSEGSVDR
jgi:oligopeptide/dipeptide ABC transporter ATP-binding protein